MPKAQNTTYTRDEYRPTYDYNPTPAQVMRTTLLNRVSWGAVFAGVVIAFVAQLVMNLIGMGVGFASIDTVSGPGVSTYEFSWAGALWWTMAGIIAAYMGGFAAGRLAGEPKESTSAWHGLISWATSILVIAVLMTSAAGTSMATMGGPFVVVMDQETAMMSSSQQTSAPDNPTLSETTPMTTAPGTANAAAVVDSDTVAAAALATALALVLGALASWFGGRAGTVNTTLNRGDGEDTILGSTH